MKIGDWVERSGKRRLVVDIEGNWIASVSKSKTVFCDQRSDLTLLPSCDSWDWQPPKPIEPPQGYRLLEPDEFVKDGDLAGAEWSPAKTTIGRKVSDVLEYCVAIEAFARKIEPKVRPMTRDEFLAAWKQRGFCPLIDSEDDIDVVNQVTESDPEYDDETVSTYKHGWVSLATLSAFKFASDETYLTVEE